MSFFTPPRPVVLFSSLSEDECARRLERAIDNAEFSLFAFSGYRGTKPFLGDIDGRQFRVFKRGFKNTFPPVLFGTFLPRKDGTQIRGEFDLETTSKIALCVFGLVGIVILTPIVLYGLREHTVPPWVAFGFAGVYIALCLLGPRIMRSNGRTEEKDISDFLCAEFEAREDQTASA
jgi:hypothetical protein